MSIVFSFSWGHFNSQEKLKTMLMQNFGVTNKEHYGMLWYFLESSIQETKIALNPNLQVAFMHVWYVCTQLSFGLAQGMNGIHMHRMQSEMHV